MYFKDKYSVNPLPSSEKAVVSLNAHDEVYRRNTTNTSCASDESPLTV